MNFYYVLRELSFDRIEKRFMEVQTVGYMDMDWIYPQINLFTTDQLRCILNLPQAGPQSITQLVIVLCTGHVIITLLVIICNYVIITLFVFKL